MMIKGPWYSQRPVPIAALAVPRLDAFCSTGCAAHLRLDIPRPFMPILAAEAIFHDPQSNLCNGGVRATFDVQRQRRQRQDLSDSKKR